MVPANSGALEGVANVRFGSKGDIVYVLINVHFTPERRHTERNSHIRSVLMAVFIRLPDQRE
jgi:hypothetical protein